MVGGFDPCFGRNRQLVRLAEMNGWEVVLRNHRAWGDNKVAIARSGRAVSAMRAAAAYVRILRDWCRGNFPEMLSHEASV